MIFFLVMPGFFGGFGCSRPVPGGKDPGSCDIKSKRSFVRLKMNKSMINTIMRGSIGTRGLGTGLHLVIAGWLKELISCVVKVTAIFKPQLHRSHSKKDNSSSNHSLSLRIYPVKIS
jgi:hypothetical protein